MEGEEKGRIGGKKEQEHSGNRHSVRQIPVINGRRGDSTTPISLEGRAGVREGREGEERGPRDTGMKGEISKKVKERWQSIWISTRRGKVKIDI